MKQEADFYSKLALDESNEIERLRLTIQRWCAEYMTTGSDRGDPVVLFGAGVTGQYYLAVMREIVPLDRLILCDNGRSKVGSTMMGVSVIGIEHLTDNFRNSPIIITSVRYADQITAQLRELGLQDSIVEELFPHSIGSDIGDFAVWDYRRLLAESAQQFEEAYELFADQLSRDIFTDRLNYCLTANAKYLLPLRSRQPAYFDRDIVSLKTDEIFVDGGAYTGDTVEEFLLNTNGSFRAIYAFEPEESKHAAFQDKFKAYPHIRLEPYGLWSRSETLRFRALDTVSSTLSDQGDTLVPVTSVDECLRDVPVTMIKLDIEGAEIEALRGAVNTITRYKPKLAVCVYHNPLDIIEVPLFLKRLIPEYKVFLRHYGNDVYDTICYAVLE